MLKEKGNKKSLLIIVAVVVGIFVIVGGLAMFQNYVSIQGQHLNTYRCGTGGGMTGGYYRENVKRYEDYALITIESADWYAQDPTVTEYKADVAVLDELEAVIRKNRMNFWHSKKFTNMFVDDGESTSYRFDFDDAVISFSSQIYPIKYSQKLAELDGVIKKYTEISEKLPGLVNPKKDEEENYTLPENKLEIYVYSYSGNTLGLRILNGTNEDIEIFEKYKLINADNGEILAEEDTPYGGRFSQQSRDEMDIRLKERLDAGNYKIIFGDLEISFEIR